MGGRDLTLAALVAAVLAASAAPASTQDLSSRRASMFDLGIYGGGAWNADIPPDELFNYPTIWSGGAVAVRQSEISLPGVGTVQRGGREFHILAPGTEHVTGVQGHIGFSFKAADNVSPTPASRFYFSYSYFQGDGSRAARVDPNTDNVAFTLDRPVVFPGGGFTTGVFAGILGMDIRQSFDINQHRFDGGLFTPFPAGPGTFILKTGVTAQFSNQSIQSFLSLVTLPNVTMAEQRDTDQQLFGPTLGGAFQFPVPIGTGLGEAPSTLFVTVGGDITPLFGQTTFHSTQVIDCVPCGPNFPVGTVSSASISDPVLDASAFFRVAASLGTRATLFGEVGVNWTERGAFVTPANPNEQPLRHEIIRMVDNYVRGGITVGLQ